MMPIFSGSGSINNSSCPPVKKLLMSCWKDVDWKCLVGLGVVAMTDDDTLSRGVVSGGTGRVFLTDRNRSGYCGNRSNRFRYRAVTNRPKFKIQIWIQKNEKKSKKILKILQVATNLMVSNFLNIHSFSILCGHLKLNKKTCIQKYTNTM